MMNFMITQLQSTIFGKDGTKMKKSGIVFILASLLLAGAAMLLRKLELLTVLDAGGLPVFKPVTGVLIALSVLAAVFYLLFARHEVEKPADRASFTAFRSLGIPGVILGAVSLVIQLLGAWLLFREWKNAGETLYLVLALLAGLAGAGWLCLRVEEYRGMKPGGSRFLAGCFVTLFYCLWLITYYRDEAAEPAQILTVYAFLALCACCVAGYAYTGGSVGRMRPRFALFFCGLALYLSLIATVRQEAGAYRIFWLAAALQFCQSGLVLLSPGDPESAPESAEPDPSEPEDTPEPAEPEEEPGEEAEPPAPEGEEG